MGYWGGLSHDKHLELDPMSAYAPSLVFPVHTDSVLANQPEMVQDSLTINGVGLVSPSKVFDFYDALHSYLAKAGVDGVKVDAQAILETLGTGYGGRVKMARTWHEALERSIAKNFKDNGIIACMSHHTDGIYSSKQTAVVRASDDFWPRDPASHTIHIASVAYNSLFLGEFMQPDWDMFHSRHPVGEYHAAARAIGGCAVYVSDKPGEHDFRILKKLVLPDGSVLRARLPGRPTRDSLFVDAARDVRSMLKIWSMNVCTGVLGAFNCQGAGWCPTNRKYTIHSTLVEPVTGSIRAKDVDALAELAGPSWSGDAVLYSHRGGEVILLPREAALPLTLRAFEYEVFTVAPIEVLPNGVSFAPIGLTNMFNSGGAISSIIYPPSNSSHSQVVMYARGGGAFAAYSSAKPVSCQVDGKDIAFEYTADSGRIALDLPHQSEHKFHLLLNFATSAAPLSAALPDGPSFALR